MLWLITSLIAVAALLFLLSFIPAKKEREEKQQLEQMNLSLMGEMYQLKKKVQVLEEELLGGTLDPQPDYAKAQSTGQAELFEEAGAMYRSGYAIPAIAREMKLTESEVQNILSRLA
ncbi:hypothetical protein B0H94_11618 [Salsuginibacillus halophilus]|uniref:Uncharacterized protein n=1 Tax=Salsuginibacillus halophilus TaxID=517424 RepID=A0A2P8H7V6_9BACI|nr:hypothetical protein [Salsuginibacillus halophilus]PSL42315.1 hypothetical protein B0H94_11618 [Salsuginibacillus halophilus]